MTLEYKYLINTIKSILHNKTKDYDKESSGFGLIDYAKAFEIAKNNSIASMVSCYICNDESVSKDIRKKYDLERLQVISQHIKQEKVIKELKDIFEKIKAKGLILKGSIVKDLYPETYMRSMADIDFYMEEEDILNIRNAIKASGFSLGIQGANSHYVFEKYGVVNVEIHSDLERIDDNYGKEIFSKLFPEAKSIAAAMGIWNHTIPFEGSSYMLQLTPEYHYLYVVMHMMKHFLIAGTGIRSFIDLWVMNHHYGNTWDRAALNELLDKFGLLRFEQYALSLADIWFDLDVPGWSAMEIDEGTLEAMEDYILQSGTYGRWDNNMLKEMDLDTSGGSKLSYLLGTVFKPLERMKSFYPILNKAPVLLPAMWVRRGLHLAIKKKDVSMKKLRAVASADQSQADKLKDLFDKLI